MENDELNKWHERYLGLCAPISSWSKDPSSQIGCVIVGRNGQILSQGYNGFARGIKDTIERYDLRSLKYRLVVHAEANAIYNASRIGVSLEGSTMYVKGLPVCNECAKAVIQSGISTLICSFDHVKPQWIESCGHAIDMLEEAGVSYYHLGPLPSKLSKLSKLSIGLLSREYKDV